MDEVQARFQGKVVAGVLATVTDPQGRALFVRQSRGPFAGHWLLPGGGLEPGEPAAGAVAREVYEETGVRIRNVRFVAVYEMQGRWEAGPYHLLMLGFRAEADGEIDPDFPFHNVAGARWARPEQIDLHPTDLRILTDAGAARFSEEQIATALTGAGIEMRVYRSE